MGIGCAPLTCDPEDIVNEGIQENIRDAIPLSRFAQPEDIAALVQFLSSEKSRYIMG